MYKKELDSGVTEEEKLCVSDSVEKRGAGRLHDYRPLDVCRRP